MATPTNSRECPVCGTPFPASTGRGRPRIYCGDVCRWKAGHEVVRQRYWQRAAEQAGWTYDDLLAWADAQQFREPY